MNHDITSDISIELPDDLDERVKQDILDRCREVEGDTITIGTRVYEILQQYELSIKIVEIDK